MVLFTFSSATHELLNSCSIFFPILFSETGASSTCITNIQIRASLDFLSERKVFLITVTSCITCNVQSLALRFMCRNVINNLHSVSLIY